MTACVSAPSASLCYVCVYVRVGACWWLSCDLSALGRNEVGVPWNPIITLAVVTSPSAGRNHQLHTWSSMPQDLFEVLGDILFVFGTKTEISCRVNFDSSDYSLVYPYVFLQVTSRAIKRQKGGPFKDIIVDSYHWGSIIAVNTRLWFPLCCDINSADVLRV